MVKAGTFPPPVRVGKHVYWSEVALRNWQQRLFAVQESWTMHWNANSPVATSSPAWYRTGHLIDSMIAGSCL